MFGIDPGSLPAVVGNATALDECTVFGGSVPVTGVCVDQQAALFAEACRIAGEAKCTYGTGAFMLACTGTAPVRSDNGLVGCPAWDTGDGLRWCLDGQVYTVGAAVGWLIDMGVMTEPADLDRLGLGGRQRWRHVRAPRSLAWLRRTGSHRPRPRSRVCRWAPSVATSARVL